MRARSGEGLMKILDRFDEVGLTDDHVHVVGLFDGHHAQFHRSSSFAGGRLSACSVCWLTWSAGSACSLARSDHRVPLPLAFSPSWYRRLRRAGGPSGPWSPVSN